MNVKRFYGMTFVQVWRLQVCHSKDRYRPLFSVRYGYKRGPHVIRLGRFGDVTWRMLERAA